MTTEYKTKQQALEMGAYYAGYSTLEECNRILTTATIGSELLGWPHSFPEKKLEVHYINNPEGVRVGLGVSPFREGYDLWLITPNSMARRT